MISASLVPGDGSLPDLYMPVFSLCSPPVMRERECSNVSSYKEINPIELGSQLYDLI